MIFFLKAPPLVEENVSLETGGSQRVVFLPVYFGVVIQRFV